jgi:hypothetical protein
MFYSLLLQALVDAVFLGRFGVSVLSGFVIAYGPVFVLKQCCPEWYDRNVHLEFEGHNTTSLLIWIVVGYIIWRLLEGVLPPITSETDQILTGVSDFLNSYPYLSWLTETPDTCE